MECKFAVGQKVSCVEQASDCRLTVGAIYTITYVGTDARGDVGVVLAEVKSDKYLGGYLAERFRPIHETQIEELRRTVRKVFDKTDKREVVRVGR